LTLNVKKLEAAYKHDIKRAALKKHKRTGEYKPVGFAKPTAVPAPLATFLGIAPGTLLPGPKITSLVWDQLNSRNLLCEDNNRMFRTNAEVTKIFGVPPSVNKSTSHEDKNGFNFTTLQTYISKALGRGKEVNTKEDELENVSDDDQLDQTDIYIQNVEHNQY
jgi:hypothetical protein